MFLVRAVKILDTIMEKGAFAGHACPLEANVLSIHDPLLGNEKDFDQTQQICGDGALFLDTHTLRECSMLRIVTFSLENITGVTM